jgi:hypothetical protein
MTESLLPPSQQTPLGPLIQKGTERKIFSLKPVMKAQMGTEVMFYSFFILGVR